MKEVFIFLSTCIFTRIFFKISGYHKSPGKVIAKIKSSEDLKKERIFEDWKTGPKKLTLKKYVGMYFIFLFLLWLITIVIWE